MAGRASPRGRRRTGLHAGHSKTRMDAPSHHGLPPHRGRFGQLRCERCALPPRACLCALVEPLALRTQVLVFLHRREVHKTTNTARLVPLALSNSQVRVVGRPEDCSIYADLPQLAPRALLLYPSDDAEVLSAAHAADGLVLVTPDGNWRQARKMVARTPELAALRKVKLPPGPLSRYELREHPDPRFLATFEALARALGILEGPQVQARLEALLAEKVARTLDTRPYGRPGADALDALPSASESIAAADAAEKGRSP